MLVCTAEEKKLIRSLTTPAKVQDFLNSIPFNFEQNRVDTAKSPIRVLRERNAHCIEGALLGAYIFSQHGRQPLLIDLKTIKGDFEHVISPFESHGFWGALSKTNHAVLRYREPVYKTVRELVLSYFHEYFLSDGRKTLRSYSQPLNLNQFGTTWPMREDDLWDIDAKLTSVRHYDIAPAAIIKNLRHAEPIEIEAGKIVEWN